PLSVSAPSLVSATAIETPKTAYIITWQQARGPRAFPSVTPHAGKNRASCMSASLVMISTVHTHTHTRTHTHTHTQRQHRHAVQIFPKLKRDCNEMPIFSLYTSNTPPPTHTHHHHHHTH